MNPSDVIVLLTLVISTLLVGLTKGSTSAGQQSSPIEAKQRTPVPHNPLQDLEGLEMKSTRVFMQGFGHTPSGEVRAVKVDNWDRLESEMTQLRQETLNLKRHIEEMNHGDQ
jgi:hypothetical protein